jgi:hypothetical protein
MGIYLAVLIPIYIRLLPMSNLTITNLATANLVATSAQVSSELSGETVILNLKDGLYFGLNAVGNSIWQQIQQPTTFSQIRSQILAEYDVEPAVCEQDLVNILNQLHRVGLVEIQDSGATCANA